MIMISDYNQYEVMNGIFTQWELLWVFIRPVRSMSIKEIFSDKKKLRISERGYMINKKIEVKEIEMENKTRY